MITKDGKMEHILLVVNNIDILLDFIIMKD